MFFLTLAGALALRLIAGVEVPPCIAALLGAIVYLWWWLVAKTR